MIASLDALQALCPNLRRVAVVATWFGTDLRAGVLPGGAEGRDRASKRALPEDWRVAGITRDRGRGGLDPAGRHPGLWRHARGCRPDPAGGRAGAPGPGGAALPVRHDGRAGRQRRCPIRASPARPSRPIPGAGASPAIRRRASRDSPDGTAAADAQVAAFFAGGYRAAVLHYADLAAGWAASGVRIAGFVIGSELVGLTRVRGAAGYPAVQALRGLAAAVRARLGPERRPWSTARTGPSTAPMSATAAPRSASPSTTCSPIRNIGAVGIDWYPPVSDWRDAPGPRRPRGRGRHRRPGLPQGARRRPARPSTGTTPTRPAAPPRTAGRSPTAPPASRGSSGPRTSSRGGRTRMSSATAASRPAPPPGCRWASRSGSPRSACRRWTRARTAPTSSPTRNPPRAPTRRNPAACATS